MKLEFVLNVYFIGYFLVGMPMGIISVIFYTWGDKFDHPPKKTLRKIIRNVLHPGSFLILPYRDGEQRDNWRTNYAGPIGVIIGKNKPKMDQIVFYLTLSSLCWPIRILISVVFVGIWAVAYFLNLFFTFLAEQFYKKIRPFKDIER